MIKKLKKKVLMGKVWSGFVGEYKKPPIYIIYQNCKVDCKFIEDTIFIDDLLIPFLTKKVCITIEEIK